MRSLKSTTAAVLAVSLTLPVPAMAQQGNQGQGKALGLIKQMAADMGLEMCEGASDTPCLTETGALRVDQPDIAATLTACEEDVIPCVTPEGLVLLEPDSDLALQAMAQVPAGELTPTEEAAPEAEAAAENETTQELDVAQEDGVSTIEEDTTADTAVPPSDESSEQAQAEEQATAEADVAAESAESDTAEAETEASTAEDSPSDDVAEEAAEDSTATDATDTAVDVELQEALDEEGVAEAVESSEPALTDTETADVQEAPAAAAAASEDAEATAEIEMEEVTEDTARSASEDFQTAVTGDATAEATTPENTGDGGGLSNFEKALILGLGAVAVGSILDNGDEIVSNSGDRVVLQDDEGNLRVLKNDDALLRQPGSQVQTETFNDGSTRTTVTREDGTKIVTIRDANGRVLRRVREFEDGSRVVLFDDTETVEPVDVTTLPETEQTTIEVDTTDEDALRLALARAEARDVGRRFSLSQVRDIRQVRELAPELDLAAITFETGSAAIQPNQAEELSALGRALSRIIEERPGEVFLIEGHTDAVGSATYNLALSDRRAETVALALTEYFDVPPENMVTQGYGESALRIQTEEAERLNRRATIRRITPLLRQAATGN